ncbi:MAG: Zn-dependent hydrolase, partial [Candidatus Lambdaproteobacteria bacterium]|nr:Zn-dependent hydrolase [Candidatus Lambdaproteobacteria bacterium]
MAEAKVNGERLWRSLMEMARIGATPAGGNCRLALSDEDRAGREAFLAWAREAGCAVTIDRMGNLFVRREGDDPAAAPVVAGSHLDTQPTGGRFDGVYGVLAGLEVLRALDDGGIRTRRPVEVVVWTNEEGSRFQPAMIGSGVFSGAFSLDYAYGQRDTAGRTFGEELARIGFKGPAPCRPRPMHAYIEAHIEQGPVLEAEDRVVGVVTGIQGIKWFHCRVRGVNAHAGTTPMAVRRDPLLGMARMVAAIEALYQRFNPDVVYTVGMLQADPGSINVINREVFFSLDLRCPDAQCLEALSQAARDECSRIAAGMGLALELEQIWDCPPRRFDPAVVQVVEQAAAAAELPHRRMVSGAGHDAGYVSDVCPTGMIFIPCKGGLSHNEA